METVQNTLVARESSGWRKSDTVWMLGQLTPGLAV